VLQQLVPNTPLLGCCAKTAASVGKEEASAIKKEMRMDWSDTGALLLHVPSVVRWALKMQVPHLKPGNYDLTLKLTEDGRVMEKRKECIATVSILDLKDDQQIPFHIKSPLQSSKNVFTIAAYEGGEDTKSMRAAIGKFLGNLHKVKPFAIELDDGNAIINIKWVVVTELHTNWVWYHYGGPRDDYNCPFCNSKDNEDRLNNFGCSEFKTFSKTLAGFAKCRPLLKIPLEHGGICCMHALQRLVCDSVSAKDNLCITE
jgi:hypothetical protein